ncbi:MAG: hypothetical protein GW858_03165 [Sphingomonadales bacterium]|nr:hypothetical protein [Sphingomonadales bacterium]NCQ20849.1 hypothetical protein [Sphingomonadales bacterium]NCT02606.1 hypothetical protein [Sphingomonadales bacterium]
MNPVTLAFAVLGLSGFALGAMVTALGPFEMGVILMGLGLAFQVISLVRLKRAKRNAANEGRSDA